ncbi:MAG: hypothetical protein M0Z58_03945 [Nitrospiraceae bacterium]|nr:hypothetical protein [Nitrospiraceae bacterium]
MERSELVLKPGAPHSGNLVFTSAGDNANVGKWIEGEKNFDLWITYYGERGRDNPLRAIGDIYNERKGGKFPNLHYAYQKWKELLDNYEAVMVMDDDIIIDAPAISRLFEIRERFGLWCLQPAFSPAGRICLPITSAHPFSMLRYTNFVEMNCPLFLKAALDEFMRVYDPALSRFGVEWWYLQTMGPDLAGKVAVVDEVVCVNPHTRTKTGGKRECQKIQSDCCAMKEWQRIKMTHGIKTDERGFRTFGFVAKGAGANDFMMLAHYLLYKVKRAEKALLRRS